ncbi:hypothetical protein ACWT_5804 [Actinoplanes sp. SE50]|uniref:hypothetical protein n=1 Tax=unclassified Actinoplanes TaxID=2626549 RepID=UPI00023EBC07|nr:MULTISPECIES: hypothetical protein [unclassified Actinoplanes]AEV86822.1 hypothetical protein ACPL_5935 [Actinoplanes sp. SE50/110]ATO85219.1 hypothetical protein ACWT_5804 [Actinoplanes sp. SE50]SLM02629.1 hypothetical protein ACSP50_5911 [Actinoplanes sp. SE50/110]
MSELRFRIDDGPLRGWSGTHYSAAIGLRLLSQTITVHPPNLPDSAPGSPRVSLSLHLEPGDPQWEVMRIFGRTQQNTPTARQIREIALGLLLPRVQAQLAVRDGWLMSRASSITAGISGQLADLTGPASTVQVAAADSFRRHRSGISLGDRMNRDGLTATFAWLLQQSWRQALPAGQDRTAWTAATDTFLRTPLPGQPHVGQIVLTFRNGTGDGLRHRVADTLHEATIMAGSYRPFNNTAVTAEQVVAIDHGLPIIRPITLDPADSPKRAQPTATAFPRPAVIVPGTPGTRPAVAPPSRPAPTPGPRR